MHVRKLLTGGKNHLKGFQGTWALPPGQTQAKLPRSWEQEEAEACFRDLFLP